MAVGATGLVWVGALFAGSVLAGSVLDAWDRRRLLIVAQLGFMLGSGLLLAGAIQGRPPLLILYSGTAIIAAFSAIDSPTRSAMTPRLVGHDLMPAAMALNQVIWNATALIGPAIAAVVIQ